VRFPGNKFDFRKKKILPSSVAGKTKNPPAKLKDLKISKAASRTKGIKYTLLYLTTRGFPGSRTLLQ
jgi:hypothetical protein